MFKRSYAERRGPTQQEGVPAEKCPKCGSPEVLGDYCPRCRVKVSTYQAYLATLSQGAQLALAKKTAGLSLRARWLLPRAGTRAMRTAS